MASTSGAIPNQCRNGSTYSNQAGADLSFQGCARKYGTTRGRRPEEKGLRQPGPIGTLFRNRTTRLSVNGAAVVLAVLTGVGLRGATAPQAEAQPAGTPAANRLVTGRLLYVSPMPDQLDKWLQSDLEQWGKYRVTSNSEGVDLEIRARIGEAAAPNRLRNSSSSISDLAIYRSSDGSSGRR